MRRLGVLFSVVALVTLTGCGEPPSKVTVGAELPAIEIPRLDGGVYELGQLRGSPSVIAFWATWCNPCREDEPVLHELLETGDVEVVSIALDERPETVRSYVAAAGLRYPVLLGDQALFSRFDGYSIPHTLVVGADGTVRAVFRGPITGDDVRSALGADRAGAGGAG